MNHSLDRPVWNALLTSHAALAEGNGLALRYPPSIVPFAAAADNSAASLEALENLPRDDEIMALVDGGPIEIPKRLTIVSSATLVQMVGERPYERISDSRVEALTEADAAGMLALATLAKPGPFTLGAQSLGTFWGVKIDGRLVAMGGQRMRHAGATELSGLCTHPDFQGQGLGKLLFRFVAGEICARGESVFLHAHESNTSAIALYEALGFRLRAKMNLRIVRRRA